MARAISARVGSGRWSSRCLARSAMPGMQKPHWTPPAAAKARANRSRSESSSPSSVRMLASRGGGGRHRAGDLGRAVDEGEAAAALPLRRAAVLQRPDAAPLAERLEQRLVGPHLDTDRRAIQREVHRNHERSASLTATGGCSRIVLPRPTPATAASARPPGTAALHRSRCIRSGRHDRLAPAEATLSGTHPSYCLSGRIVPVAGAPQQGAVSCRQPADSAPSAP